MIVVYVAGASSERERVRAFMREVDARDNIALAHDWLSIMEEEHRSDGELSQEDAFEYACEDFDGIDMCDVFVLLAPTLPSTGSWIELGYALRRRKGDGTFPRIVVSGEVPSIFRSHANTTVQHDTDAVSMLDTIAAIDDRKVPE